MDLLSNASATGSAVQWPGGPGVFKAVGTFGGATVSLEYLAPNGSSWVAMGSDTTLTAAGGGQFTSDPCRIRASVTGGAPSALYATANQW